MEGAGRGNFLVRGEHLPMRDRFEIAVELLVEQHAPDRRIRCAFLRGDFYVEGTFRGGHWLSL